MDDINKNKLKQSSFIPCEITVFNVKGNISLKIMVQPLFIYLTNMTSILNLLEHKCTYICHLLNAKLFL